LGEKRRFFKIDIFWRISGLEIGSKLNLFKAKKGGYEKQGVKMVRRC
jgi:hypothetical protein